MIYLDITIDKWLEKYPHLQRASLLVCDDYDLKLDSGRPFVSRDKIGIVFERGEAPPIRVKASNLGGK